FQQQCIRQRLDEGVYPAVVSDAHTWAARHSAAVCCVRFAAPNPLIPRRFAVLAEPAFISGK
ncbi:MAG: hypothetical protein QOI59_5969, partial [Gammaproteobacteria bacterium]|nr:hypothetical protein [Gammaproteobacteria bacterium]